MACPRCKAERNFDPLVVLNDEGRLCFDHSFTEVLHNVQAWIDAVKREREKQRRELRGSISQEQANYYESQSLAKQPL